MRNPECFYIHAILLTFNKGDLMKKGDVVNLTEDIQFIIGGTTIYIEKDAYGLVLSDCIENCKTVSVKIRISDYACIKVHVSIGALKINKFAVWIAPER
jgi:hypothetical protein